MDPESSIEPVAVRDGGDLGQVLRVVARDPGAPEDLPAGSRLTGHRLARAVHPVYDHARKENPIAGVAEGKLHALAQAAALLRRSP